jgi:hypothetical protein
MPVSLRLCRIDCRDGNLYVYGPMFMIICQGEAQDQGLFEEERPVCMPKSSGVHHGVVVEAQTSASNVNLLKSALRWLTTTRTYTFYELKLGNKAKGLSKYNFPTLESTLQVSSRAFAFEVRPYPANARTLRLCRIVRQRRQLISLWAPNFILSKRLAQEVNGYPLNTNHPYTLVYPTYALSAWSISSRIE